MDRLPILGKEIIIKNPLCRDIELHGLVQITCPECGKSITTFLKCINNAHAVICNECGYIYKQCTPTVKLQKQVMKMESSYYKDKYKSTK